MGKKRESKKWITYVKKNEKSSYPGEINRHKSPGTTESLKPDESQQAAPRHMVIKMPNVKDKERIIGSKWKAGTYLQGRSHKTVSWFLNRNFVGQKELARNIQSGEKQGLKPILL